MKFCMITKEYVSGMLEDTSSTPHFSVALNEMIYAYGPRTYSEAEVILASRGKVRPSTFTQRSIANKDLTELELARANSKTWSMEQE